jgi:catechol 2,3-dioxygenase-like lactoylglutathione lyase family enzyme
MEVPGVKIAPSDNSYIHSQLGFRYLTIYVDDMAAAMKRLRDAGGAPVGGPIAIANDPAGSHLTVVRDPDGNLIELIGPSK